MVERKVCRLETVVVAAVMSAGLTVLCLSTNCLTKRCIAFTTSAATGCFSFFTNVS